MIHDGTIIIDSQLLKLIAELDEFKGRWEALGRLSPEKLSSLRRVSTIESVGSSTRIEGARLSDHAVETLLANLQMHSFRSRDEEEAAGYAEAMNTVLESYEDIPFTENHIRQLHGILLRHSAKDSSHRGEYKKFPNHVVAFDADGNSLGVIFETASPFDTPRRMAELMDWANAAFAEREPHPLLAIAAFVVHFLAIHPYQDGNGRLSRVLTTLMLLKHGYLYVPYSSLERIVEGIHRRGALVVVGGVSLPLVDRGYGEVYEELRERTGCLVIANVLDDVIGRPALMSDRIHPNARGYAVVAERFHEAVGPYL